MTPQKNASPPPPHIHTLHLIPQKKTYKETMKQLGIYYNVAKKAGTISLNVQVCCAFTIWFNCKTILIDDMSVQGMGNNACYKYRWCTGAPLAFSFSVGVGAINRPERSLFGGNLNSP